MAADSNVSVPSNSPSNPSYSPPYPWQETGVVLFLVLALGLVFVRWLPGYLKRREIDARDARNAALLAELKRDEDERLLKNTLLSRHLNYSQVVLDDLLATQNAIAKISDGQLEQVRLMRTAYSRLVKQQTLQVQLLERVLAQVEGLRSDVRGDVLFRSSPASAPFTRPKGVGQSPDQPIRLENSGIDV